jgi:predicted dehydrogenase
VRRIAMLSFAHYHANFWTEQFLETPGIKIACIWDDDTARGQEAASRFGLRFEADLDAAIAAADAVAICSETRAHLPLALRATAAGRAILCEKPTARGIAEAEAMADAVRQAGVLFMQSFPKRLDPASHALRALVAAGRLGRIHTVRIRHGHFYGLAPDFRSRWYVHHAQSGGGALLDEGVHGADLLCWLFGLPASVVATTSSALLDLEVEENATALFTWPDGMTAELTASFLFAAGSDSVELYGTEGTALLAGVDLASRDITPGPFLRVFSGSGERVWEAQDLVPQFKRGRFHHQNAIAFARCLLDGAPPPATLEDGRRALLMIERAYAAAATGQRQEIRA